MADMPPHPPPEPWPAMENVVVVQVDAHRFHRREGATGYHRPYEHYVALMVEPSLAGAIIPRGTKLSRTLVWMLADDGRWTTWKELVRLASLFPPANPNRIRWTREEITMPEMDA